jgi:hypothetical protein
MFERKQITKVIKSGDGKQSLTHLSREASRGALDPQPRTRIKGEGWDGGKIA